jgi:hemoglobin-like flavoprotein
MLQWIVGHLDRRAELKTHLRELGERHARYGARPEHYPIVVEVMLATMAQVAGGAWNEDLAGDWRTALERVAAVMLGQP